ncbi:Porphobilinogen deaminase [Corynebacterium deserti GIMN1.010]|uniref:Porphobilinogen deaminase n=1 Tax=Corynebacterium deserti GIMN1.010 TaxID=931089 RepID=A0A0M3Q920_9CORY|nr:hydroxymethylbilane synthase [Corynebacterium deserti]ALC04919.1 Porphobilinogen deaminase [Corynebacterium deserti GIMN1.010]
MTLKIGTRGSKLATTQAGHIRDQLKYFGRDAELHIVTTPGDVNMSPVERIGVGVFTQALRDVLEAGECDIAVHSMKDLPTAADPRFHLVVPTRADAREALIARDGLTLSELPEGAKVGTSAPRRVSQLKAIRPDLEILPLRGNIDTRMGKVASGELDAVMLAYAGLSRVGMQANATEVFDADVIMPAPAQGALAIECRVDDTETVRALNMLMHADTFASAIAERTVLNRLEAGCTAPVAAHATLGGYSGDMMTLTAGVFALDGSQQLVYTAEGPGALPEELGEQVAQELIDAGAASLL